MPYALIENELHIPRTQERTRKMTQAFYSKKKRALIQLFPICQTAQFYYISLKDC